MDAFRSVHRVLYQKYNRIFIQNISVIALFKFLKYNFAKLNIRYENYNSFNVYKLHFIFVLYIFYNINYLTYKL